MTSYGNFMVNDLWVELSQAREGEELPVTCDVAL